MKRPPGSSKLLIQLRQSRFAALHLELSSDISARGGIRPLLLKATGGAQTANVGFSRGDKSFPTKGAFGHHPGGWRAVTTFAPCHPSGEEPWRSPARAEGRLKERGLSNRANPRSSRRHHSLHARYKLKIGKNLGSRYRGPFRFPRRSLARASPAGRVRGDANGGDIPRCGVVSSRGRGQISPSWSSFLGGRGACLRRGD
jgi:hypothetical protein